MGKKFWANVTLSVVLGGLFAVAVTSVSSALTPKGLFITEPKPSTEVATLLPKIKLVNYNLSEDPNRMVRAEFIVKNSSEQDIKNLKVLCEFYDPSGNYLDRKTWLLSGKVPAGKTMQHNSDSERYVHSRSSGLKCNLTDFELAKRPSFVLHRVEGGHGAAAEGAGHGAPAHGAPAGH